MMFLAGVLADPDNPDHLKAFEKTLQAIGSTPEEAEGNSPSAVLHAKRMSLNDLDNHFARVLDARKPLIDMHHKRMEYLTTNNATIDFHMGS